MQGTGDRASRFAVVLSLTWWVVATIPVAIWGWGKIESRGAAVASSASFQKLLQESSSSAERNPFVYGGQVFETRESLEAYRRAKEPPSAAPQAVPPKYLYDGKAFASPSDVAAYAKVVQTAAAAANGAQAPSFQYGENLFATLDALRDYLREKQGGPGDRDNAIVFGWAIAAGVIRWVQDFFDERGLRGWIAVLVTTAFSFGAIGGVTALMRDFASEEGRKKITVLDVYLKPIFAGMIGFMVLGFVEVLPILFQTNTDLNVVRPSTLFFLAFFGGMSAQTVYELCVRYLAKVLASKLGEVRDAPSV